MTKKTNIIKIVNNMKAGEEFYAMPLNFSEKQINDLRTMIQDGILEPINFIDRVNEQGAKDVISGRMILPDAEFKKM